MAPLPLPLVNFQLREVVNRRRRRSRSRRKRKTTKRPRGKGQRGNRKHRSRRGRGARVRVGGRHSIRKRGRAWLSHKIITRCWQANQPS